MSSLIDELPGVDRYHHFVLATAANGCAWGLYDDDGWTAVEGPDRTEPIVLWPSQTNAKSHATDAWAACEPRSVSLDELLDDWTPRAVGRGDVFAIHYTAEREPFYVSPDDLASDLRAVLHLDRRRA